MTDRFITIAKRYNNKKRSYLLVNPSQGKHLAVAPEAPLAMFEELSSAIEKAVSDVSAVIGFAETATAIGAGVAAHFGCFFLQTTREDVGEEDILFFTEEHSHATAQKIAVGKLSENLGKGALVLIDDELTTGNTMRNLVEKLRSRFPELQARQLICASVTDRISDDNRKKLTDVGIVTVSLVRPEEEDYTEKVGNTEITEPASVAGREENWRRFCFDGALPNMRTGVDMQEYLASAAALTEKITEQIREYLTGRVLLLGTEEFMYFPLLLADVIGKKTDLKVDFHATTRSPIGICGEENYPVKNGYRIASAYEKERLNFVYDLKPYDTVIVVTDGNKNLSALYADIADAVCRYGTVTNFIGIEV